MMGDQVALLWPAVIGRPWPKLGRRSRRRRRNTNKAVDMNENDVGKSEL